MFLLKIQKDNLFEGVNVTAEISGDGNISVEPSENTTDANGFATFRFKFGLTSSDGVIAFKTDDSLTAILVQENLLPIAANNQ